MIFLDSFLISVLSDRLSMLCLAKRITKNWEHLYHKILMVNQPHHENLHVWSPQDFHGQSIASDEISSVGTESFRYGIENN